MFEKKTSQSQKKLEGGPFSLVQFAKARDSCWLKDGLEPATVGFSLNRLRSVPKSGTYMVSSAV